MSAADAAADLQERAGSTRASYIAAVSRPLIRCVPVVTAETLAICRVIFGASILYFWLASGPEALASLGRSGPIYPFTKIIDQTGFLTLLSLSPQIRLLLYWSIVSLLAAFIVGFLTRVLYPTLVILFWLAAFLHNQGHFITPLLLAMTATLVAPWSARWSVDSVFFGGHRGTPVATPFFGYPIWLLGLTIGLAYTAAGLSKLIITEGAWLWETGARNGLIQDLGYAVTDWGMTISNSYPLSLGASILSAIGQAIYVWASFTRSPVVKYGIGLFVAFPFLIGLALFMGLFWWPWAILVVILYLPWPTIDRLVTPGRMRSSFTGSALTGLQRSWFLTATFLLISVHLFAVLTRTEYEPIYSNYPMYAERMPANSDYEKKFWARFKSHDRHYKYNVQIVSRNGNGSDSIRDISAYYDIAHFLQKYSLADIGATRFDFRTPFTGYVETNTPLSVAYCSELRKVALGHASRPSAIRFARRYFDLADGQMTWLPVTRWTEVDLTAPDCPYRQVEVN